MPACKNLRSVILVFLVTAPPAAASAATALTIGDEAQVDTLALGSGYRAGDLGYWIGNNSLGYVYDCWGDDVSLSDRSSRIFCRTYLAGEPLNEPARVDTSRPGGYLSPRGCTDDTGNLYVVWLGFDPGGGVPNLYFNRSGDRGLTWEGADRQINQLTGSVARVSRPEIACDGQGHIYVMWKDTRLGAYHLFFNRSLDYGETWETDDVQVDASPAAIAGYHERVRLASDAEGHVYAVWLDARSGGNHLFLNHSSSYGASWQPDDARIDRSPGPLDDPDVALPSIALGGKGQVYLAWSDARQGAPHMRLNRSADFGDTWQKADQRIDSAGAIQTVWGSIAADDQGRVYGVWFYNNAEAGVFDVRFSSSSDSGVTWQPSETVIGTTGVAVHPFAPNLAADRAGRVYATWLRYSGGGRVRHAYVNASSDAGVSWAGGDQGIAIDQAPAEMDVNLHEPILSCNRTGSAAVTWLDRRDPQQTHMFMNTLSFTP